MTTLEQRMARLEKSNRWHRALLGVAGVVLLVVLCAGGGPPQIENPFLPQGPIFATAFVVADKDGVPRAMMGIHEGKPVFALIGPDNKQGVGMSVDEDGGVIEIMDGEDAVLIRMGGDKHGGYLRVRNRAYGKIVAGLGVSDLQTGFCRVRESGGQVRAGLGVYKAEGRVMTLAPSGDVSGVFP